MSLIEKRVRGGAILDAIVGCESDEYAEVIGVVQSHNSAVPIHGVRITTWNPAAHKASEDHSWYVSLDREQTMALARLLLQRVVEMDEHKRKRAEEASS